MNRNEIPPDPHNSKDEKDYKTIVLLVLGIFIVVWQALPSFFSTGTASDTSAHATATLAAREKKINLHALSVTVTAGSQQNLELLPSLPNQLRPLFFQPISINKSNQQLLESIPGIGPHLSGQIVNYRKAHGEFTDLHELLNVHGIGEKKLAIIKKHTVL